MKETASKLLAQAVNQATNTTNNGTFTMQDWNNAQPLKLTAVDTLILGLAKSLQGWAWELGVVIIIVMGILLMFSGDSWAKKVAIIGGGTGLVGGLLIIVYAPNLIMNVEHWLLSMPVQ